MGGVGGTSAGPSTSSQKRPRSAQKFLPPWMESATSYTVNTSMPSLEGRYTGLKRWIPEVKKENMAHISGGCVICPCMALSGKKIVHASNGTFVALVGDVVYANCSDRSCTWRKTEDADMDEELLVEGSAVSGHPWVKYTEDNYTRLGGEGLKKARNHGGRPSDKP